mmetsp:Transcript_12713/g.12560  ORF Transcript_12713/g.12560 Transcript_12713/m.12560 type:complete len:102 (+) Transcript_12713:98-403(+)
MCLSLLLVRHKVVPRCTRGRGSQLSRSLVKISILSSWVLTFLFLFIIVLIFIIVLVIILIDRSHLLAFLIFLLLLVLFSGHHLSALIIIDQLLLSHLGSSS